MMFVFTVRTLPLKEKKKRFINSELIIGSLFIPLSSYNAYSPKKNLITTSSLLQNMTS